MHQHRASVQWQRQTADFDYGSFNRDHRVGFENGQIALNSAAPAFNGNGDALNPETLLLAALVSCHMLTFLAVASKRGFVVDSYQDEALGSLDKNADGKMAIVEATLQPRISFSGKTPSAEELRALHDKAHANCFIAQSLRTMVTIAEPA